MYVRTHRDCSRIANKKKYISKSYSSVIKRKQGRQNVPQNITSPCKTPNTKV